MTPVHDRRRSSWVIPAVLAAACSSTAPSPTSPPHPRAPVIDRFSSAAGHLMVRGPGADLPGPGQPIDLDRPPFITQGLGPDGSIVRYYNFDVQPAEPATLYRLTRAGAREPLPGQLDLVDAIPGDPGYSDFWRVSWVEVPDSVAAGSITSAAQLRDLGHPIAPDWQILDCPIVPRGTTAREAHAVAPPVTTELWYRGARVTCLLFGAPLAIDDGRVPTSPIYVTFTPQRAFRTEPTTTQTHNVVLSLPGDTDYSPLWAVHIYDRAAFDQVHDATTALAAPLVEAHGPLVNCPIVHVAPRNAGR